MNRTTVFSKTGKGLLEIKNKSNRLSKDQFRVLNLVDGKATLDDLVDKGRIAEVELRKVLHSLSEGGFIKEFTNPTATGDYTSVTIPPVPPSTSYVDDLDFTQILGPSKPSKPGFYQSAQTEQRQREEAERKASEAAASRAREEADRRAKDDAARRAREEEMARRVREDAERKAKEEQARREKLEAEMRYRLEEPKRAKEEAERRAREKLEAEARAKEEAERKVREEAERRAKIQAEAAARVEAERKRKEDEERKRKEDEERKRREEEERRRREEEERKRREEEERRRREEEERKRREEEERKRKEEEERRRREEEERRREEEERRRKEEEERKRKEQAERLQRDLEERHRREQEELARRLEQGLPSEEEERKQREAEERRRREEEGKRLEEEERRRRDEEARRRRDEEERARRDEEERRRRDEELARSARDEESSWSPLPTLEVTDAPAPAISNTLDSDLDALKRAEAEVEKEFMAKEEAIRKALEEQERRFRLEEEARTAMDRAEREAREKADQEARELAAAAERARREAEQRAREEGVKRQQEEKEQRAKDQEERRKKSEEDRKKRERERREQEQRAREEALANKRAEQEEIDRKKAERERLAREAKKRAWGPGRIAAISGIALLVLIIGGIQVAPLSAYAPEMEKLASERIGEPVRIGAVHASLFPGFHLKLENVTVGQQQDVRVPGMTAYMDIGSVFGGEKLIKTLELEQVHATEDALGRVPGWLANTTSAIKVRKIVLRNTKLEVRGAEVPAFNAQLFLAPDGSLTRATIDTLDGHFDAELLNIASGAEVSARVKNFSLPLGPALEVSEGTAKGVLNGNQIRLSEMTLYLYGGQAKGQAALTWGSSWTLEGDFELKRVDLGTGMKALKIDIPSEGLLDAKGNYALQANSLPALFDNPRVEANFSAQKGALSGFDLVRALQAPTRDGVQGGKTKFDDLSGTISVAGAHYSYGNARLHAGLLNANGACEVMPNREINGRAYVELRSSSNVVKNTFRITGNLKAIILKP